MNRTLYKVVFNKHRNSMMAVAENAKREGKNTADTQAAGISPNDISGFTGFIHSISVISFSLSLLLGSALILTSPSANAQGIVADKSAPVQQQPTIMQTGNGIPQANIQTPTAAGVSVNQYTHFNVDNRGAILNNSRRNVQTQLGGWIQGNPYLAGGEARVIVNQVNSANPSLLGGYIEVGGRRAEVVVANPAGIQVNGGGFINASRATLTTGQPQYQAGGLSGFKMRQGNVVIAGHGLDARDTDYTQILSRAVKIDGPVWGKDVRVLAGQNDVSADGSIQSSHSPAANTNSANSLYAIDTGALGGMYAGKITLISTDRDASVRNQGQLFASAGNVAVNAEGKLANTGTIAATGENHAVSLHARNVRNSGTIASQDAVDIRSRGLDNRNGSVTAAGVLSVDSRNIDNRNGSLLSVNNTQLTVSDDLDNRHGEIATNRQLSIHDKNQNTLALNNADGTIQSAGNISLQAKSLANNGTLTAGNKLDIALADDFVVERDLTAGNQLNLSTKGRLKNTHTLQAGHTLKLNAGNIDNQVTGKIIAGEQTDITSEQHVDNRGLINSNGLTRISAVQTLTNTGTGKIYGNHIALGAQKLLNREEAAEGGTKAGVIAARERLDIGARETGNRNDALISSEGRLNIGGSLDGNNEASGRATLLTNTGAKIEAGSDARISADKLYNLNADFRVEDYIDSQRHLQSFYRNAEAVPFFTQDDGHHLKEDHDLNFYFKDGRHIHIHKYGVEGIWKADYTQTVYKQHIIADRPGEILIGGNLDAQGNWSNQNSRILAGLDLNSDGITNLATLMKVRTVNDRMAQISVTGAYTRGADNSGTDAILALHADNDINLNAATVSNQVKGGTTRITAGNNLNLGTIRTEHREAYGALDDENHRHVRQSAEVGSSIRTQNGALLKAGNDLKIRQGELEADEGKTVLAAGRDVTISEGRQITELDASVSGKRKGILSSTKTHDRYRFSHDEAVGSNIGGGKMIVAAGQDINVRGSNLISDNSTVLKAGHDIDISTAHNRYTGNEYHESKKSGVMGTGGLGFTIGNRKTTDDTDRTNIVHTGSIIGSLNGDTVTVAGNRYRQTGSTVSSPEGRNTVTAKSIDVESPNNRYATDYVHTREQKGLTVALNVPVVQAAQNFVQAAQNVGKSKNKRVNAMAAANAAWQGYQAAQQMQQFAPSSSAGQGQNNQSSAINVSVTYGEQKSRNEQKSRYTEAAASQIIGKGHTTLAATGGGEQSNINITGSDVIGHAGTTLIADNHIKLQSAKHDGSEQSKNKSSGWNAGVAVQIGDGISLGITAGGSLGKGKGQGESTTHRHTHIGSTAGKTTIRSGGDTTLKGAQLIGKGVQADTRNLHIESVQDTETYQSKQQNGNVQVTVGYGFSASGSYSQSKVKADHASVTEQSGIYAGETQFSIVGFTLPG